MSDETKRILNMVAEGKITADEAAKLLAKLGNPGSDTNGAGQSVVAMAAVETRRPLKHLRIRVDSSDGEQVNIRIPLAFVRTGIKLSTVMPTGVAEKLAHRGVDLSHLTELDGEELMEALRELNIEVDSSKGDRVRIYCE
jgi:hypothetical protein